MKKFEKGVLIDGDGEYMFVGFTEEEIKLAMENPKGFDAWLQIHKL
jgi:hypothetical protein